jgi:nicotinate-nucleotide adenylyltransferase
MCPDPQRRVGLLGGSFDPPHAGHLWMARRAREIWTLDEIWLLPAFLPPHKNPADQADYRHRAFMAALLAERESWLRLCELERERGGPSYTLDTVLELKARHGASCEFHLILGGDSLADLPSWHEPERLSRELPLLVLARAGFEDSRAYPCVIDRGEMHPAQSRLIRARVADDEPTDWLDDRVRDYIREQGLYRPAAGEQGPEGERS